MFAYRSICLVILISISLAVWTLDYLMVVNRKERQALSASNPVIKTSAENVFELNPSDRIFMYSDRRDWKLEISNLSGGALKVCYKSSLKNLYNAVQLKTILRGCGPATYFYVGKVFNSDISKRFYFSTRRVADKGVVGSKAIGLVLPISNLYAYGTYVDRYREQKKSEVFYHLSEVPVKEADSKWETLLFRAITNLESLLAPRKLKFIPDYRLESSDLSGFQTIVFPLHQEYISKKMILAIRDFLQHKGNRVLSFGGANFYREISISHDAAFEPQAISYSAKLFPYRKSGLISIDRDLFQQQAAGLVKCTYDSTYVMTNIDAGEISEVPAGSGFKNSSAVINCGARRIPLATKITNFSSKGGFFHFNSDGSSIQLNQFSESVQQSIRDLLLANSDEINF